MDYAENLAAELESSLSLDDLAAPEEPISVATAATEIEREIQKHQDAVADFQERASNARKIGRATIAALQEQKRQSKARAAEEQRRLDDDIAKDNALMAEEIVAAERLAGGRGAALEVLQA